MSTAIAPARQGIPFRPDPSAKARAGLTTLTRTLTAHALAKIDKGEQGSPEYFARKLWRDDREVERLTRSAEAVSPNARVIRTKAAVEITSTTNTPSVTQIGVADLLLLLGQVAGAEVLARTFNLVFDRNAALSIPAFLADAIYASFIREGAPAPIYALQLTALLLEPYKCGTGTVLTREMLTGSPVNVQARIEDALLQCLALMIDGVLFGTGDAVADLQPAGLRFGIAALPASAAADPVAAMKADVSAVAAAVAPVAGNTEILLVADPVHAMTLRAHRRDLPTDVALGSSALAPGVLMAIAPNAVASAMGDVEIEVSDQAAIHMSTTPSDIGTEGAPPVVAAPSVSLWQTDCVSLLPRLDISWQHRDGRAVSWLVPTNW
ncbi:hypothetical protein [Bradyrhizobium japonicum]|uniref:hypothetical protein n=1 Tax=Bradyrhizobium japonicum TaxID=375 RepID=UPI001BABD33F|nr:hypothetical protein [Bradyrhizobium japonicum]